jgi:hypothetical protein
MEPLNLASGCALIRIELWLGGVELWLGGRFLGKGRHLLELLDSYISHFIHQKQFILANRLKRLCFCI